MPIALIHSGSMQPVSAYVSTLDRTQEQRFRHYFESDAVRSTIDEIRVSGVTYPLRRSRSACFIPGRGEFLVEGCSPNFVGRGATLDNARENWLLTVHAAFQELLHMRAFEMNGSDRRKWDTLTSMIDVAVYRNTTPIQIRQFGRIRRARPYPSQIKWENGDREDIRIEQVADPNFITYKPGQYFEAIVVRDPVDFRLIRIVHIERRMRPSRLDPSDEAELLAAIGSSSTLPSGGWE